MSTSTKSKSLVIAVVILLLTNIAMLAFILFNKAPQKKPWMGREGMMTEFLQKDIGFTKEQMTLYDTLSSQHKERMKMRFDQIRGNKENVYKELGSQAFADSAIAFAATRLSSTQQEIETNMLKHFAAVRKICTPEQQVKFDSLFYKLWNKMGDKGKDRKRKTE